MKRTFNLFLIAFFIIVSAKDSLFAQDIKLSAAQLKAVEGVFQNPRNADMYLSITAAGDAIISKMLWNNSQVRLTPESELVFFNKEANEGNPLRATFKKDSTGAVTELLLGNRDTWKRVYNYKPVVKLEMTHTPEQLKPFEGLFQVQNGQPRFMQLTVKNNKLALKQHWDGNEIFFIPESELSFYNPDQLLLSLVFTKDKEGNIAQVLVSKRDTWNKIMPVHPTTEQLKQFEGKYQFKDDEDNYLQLIARSNKLVVKQLWDGKEIPLVAQTDTYFYNEEQSYSLMFLKDKEGAYPQLKVLGIDLFTKVKD